MDAPLKLVELQQRFSHFLYSACPDRTTEEWIGVFVEMKSPQEVQSRLQVYRNNLVLALTGVLRETYPVTEQILSKEVFLKIARQYVYSYPSKHHDLNRYGQHFTEFLCAPNAMPNESKEALSAHLFLPDLAKLEWHWSECMDLLDDAALEPEQARELITRYGALCSFKLRASGRVVEPSYAVLDLWKKHGKKSEDAHRFDVKIPRRTQRLFLWKDDFRRRVHEIESMLWPVLSAIQQGATLGQISELPAIRERPQLLSECLQVMLARGWISGIGKA